MKAQIQRRDNTFKSKYSSEDYDTARSFATKIYKEFGVFIKAIMIFGGEGGKTSEVAPQLQDVMNPKEKHKSFLKEIKQTLTGQQHAAGQFLQSSLQNQAEQQQKQEQENQNNKISQNSKNLYEKGDIDILIVVDNVSFYLTPEIVEVYREVTERIAIETSKRLHITTLRITSFWEYMRVGDPIGINILRSGVPYVIRDVVLSGITPEDKSFEPVFEKILAEIKLSFDFYEKQFPSEVIDKIIIYSKLPLENWHEIVGKELQIPVEMGDPLRGIRVKSGIVPARAAVCFGLALRGLAEPFIDINLCKEKLLVYKKKELFLRMVFIEASIAVFLLIVFKVFTINAIAPLTNELNKTLSERPKAEVSIKSDSMTDLEKIKNEMETRKHILENLISSRTYLTSRLQDIVKILPQNMWLSEVNFEEKIDKKNTSKIIRFFNIKGYYVIDEKAGDKDVVNVFLSKLKETSGINKGMPRADIVSVKRIEMKGVKVSSFEISFTGP